MMEAQTAILQKKPIKRIPLQVKIENQTANKTSVDIDMVNKGLTK
jgi:hypothetical protein